MKKIFTFLASILISSGMFAVDFLRFGFFRFAIWCAISPRDDPETTERTPSQLPANKKCCLLIFAIGSLVLGDFPPSIPSFPSGHSGISGTAVPLPLGCPALRGPR